MICDCDLCRGVASNTPDVDLEKPGVCPWCNTLQPLVSMVLHIEQTHIYNQRTNDGRAIQRLSWIAASCSTDIASIIKTRNGGSREVLPE